MIFRHAEKPVIKDEKTGVTLEEGKDYEIVYPEDIKNAGEITGDGFIEGEGATFNVTGSITDVGSTNNAFTYAMNEGTNADNYNVTVVEGTLTVSEQPVVPTSATPTTPSNNTPARTNNVPARVVTNPTTTTPAPEATVEPEKAETTPVPTAKPEKIKEEATPQAAPKGHWALINLVAAMLSVVLAVVVFILTENLAHDMVLVEKWTVLMVLFGLISIVSTYFARKWHEEDEDED
ncbi:hypothetical protein [Bulleidia sp. HCP3S3_F2]|uniref:hypothetical protein n=1 Tax=unclassified Bulleidia TaxID=2704656 RepID=UPI003F8A2485